MLKLSNKVKGKKQNLVRTLSILLPGILFFPIAYISFTRFMNFSWVILLLLISIYIFYLGLKTRQEKLKIFFYNIFAVCFALLIYESYLWINNPSLGYTQQIIESEKYTSEHPYLGYGIAKEGVFNSIRLINDTVIYDANYTFRNGLRATANSNDHSEDCLLFFGCSVTFGEGLSDSQTMPFYYNQSADQKYRVFNYGFSGFGPHQMLAQIENRVFKDLSDCKGSKIAIYSFLPEDHVLRAAGIAQWDQFGPRYEFVNDELKHAGQLNSLPKRLYEILVQSYAYKRLFIERTPKQKDYIRTIEIIKKSKKLLAEGGIEFVLLFRSQFYEKPNQEYFLSEMIKSNVPVLFLTDTIPDYYDNLYKYTFHKYDKHPVALANEITGKYLYNQLTKR